MTIIITELKFIEAASKLSISAQDEHFEEVVMRNICKAIVEEYDLSHMQGIKDRDLNSVSFWHVPTNMPACWGKSSPSPFEIEDKNIFSNYRLNLGNLENNLIPMYSKYNLTPAVNRVGKISGEVKPSVLLGEDILITLKEVRYEGDKVCLLPDKLYYTLDSMDQKESIIDDFSKIIKESYGNKNSWWGRK